MAPCVFDCRSGVPSGCGAGSKILDPFSQGELVSRWFRFFRDLAGDVVVKSMSPVFVVTFTWQLPHYIQSFWTGDAPWHDLRFCEMFLRAHKQTVGSATVRLMLKCFDNHVDDSNPAPFNLHHTSFLVSPIRVNGLDACYRQVGLTKWTQNIGCNVHFFFMSSF